MNNETFCGYVLEKTEVEPKKNGTIPEYYAFCIQSAIHCLNNTEEGLANTKQCFLMLMKKMNVPQK